MATVLTPTRTDLTKQREEALSRSRLSEEQLRLRASNHQLSVDEYVILRELEEIDYLLGYDADGSADR